MECPECDLIVSQEPEPKMKPEYYNLPEELQDRISYDESREKWQLNVKDYDKKHDAHDLRLAKHLVSCPNKSCKQVCKNWEEDNDLSVYIKQARSQV